MNKQYKYLIWSGTGVLIILALFLLAATNQVVNTAATTNTVSFSGEGRVSAKPDVAVVDFSIVTNAATSKAAQDTNSQKSQKVTDFLKKSGVEDKDVKTTGYNVYPQYSYPRPCSPNYPCTESTAQITSYQVIQSFQVKVRDLDKVSSVLDGLVSAGANQVNNLGLQVDNPEKLKDEARAKAIADAKTRANVLKNQVGIKLGKIVNFSEGGNYPYPVYFEAKDSGRGMGGGGGPSVPVGENEIVVNVTLTYQIK